MEELSKQLKDKQYMQQLRENVSQKRMLFCFDSHIAELITFFRKVFLQKTDLCIKHQFLPTQIQQHSRQHLFWTGQVKVIYLLLKGFAASWKSPMLDV